MTNSYFKVAGTGRMETKTVDLDEEIDVAPGEDATKSVACHGYIRAQRFFFCDDSNPGSLRKAYDDAVAAMMRLIGEDPKAKIAMSVFRRPSVGGPWDDLPVVGASYGELS